MLADCLVPRLDTATERHLAVLALRLCAVLPWHDALWRCATEEGLVPAAGPAIDVAERRALATAIDVAVGRAFGLSRDDVAWIVRGCDHEPVARGHRKGFWRVERTLPPAERRPVRWLRALG